MLKLYSYYRSSAAFRVRIALELKGLDWECIPVDLLNDEQKSDAYRRLNPQGLVPAMDIGDDYLTQSLAIIEWLDERYPDTALLPSDPLAKAVVRALAYQVAMEMHPLNNLRVLNYLKSELDLDEARKMLWYRHWIAQGFRALEQSLQQLECGGLFCFGGSATLADVCLIPQVYNARRYECDLTDYPLIRSVWEHCASLTPFQRAAPESQPDYPERH